MDILSCLLVWWSPDLSRFIAGIFIKHNFINFFTMCRNKPRSRDRFIAIKGYLKMFVQCLFHCWVKAFQPQTRYLLFGSKTWGPDNNLIMITKEQLTWSVYWGSEGEGYKWILIPRTCYIRAQEMSPQELSAISLGMDRFRFSLKTETRKSKITTKF